MRIKIFYPEVYNIARFGKKRKEYPPFGILYLAAILEKMGQDVQLQAITPESDGFDLRDYDVIMYSLSASCVYKMMLSNKERSNILESSIVIVGGIHASIFPYETLRDFRSDYVIKGEGEISLYELMRFLLHERVDDNIKGVLSKKNPTLAVENSDIVTDLDLIPYPARHLLPEEDFIMVGRLSKRNIKMTRILTSRGCPFNCYFCGGQIKNLRYRNGLKIKQELEMLIEKYGIQGFVINDENFTVNKKRVVEICEAIADLKLPWSSLSRVDTIDEEMAAAMAKAGCIELKFGFESGSDTMLQLMNKRATVAQAQRAIDICYRSGIKVKGFLIHGFPGENETTTSETINFINKNKEKIDRVSLFRWTPLPGSYVYDNADKYGLDCSKLTFENAIIYSDIKQWFIDDEINKMLDEQYLRLKDCVETFKR